VERAVVSDHLPDGSAKFVICGSRKLELVALGYGNTRFSDPAHPACAALKGAVTRRDPTSAEECSFKQVVAPGSAGTTSEKGPLGECEYRPVSRASPHEVAWRHALEPGSPMVCSTAAPPHAVRAPGRPPAQLRRSGSMRGTMGTSAELAGSFWAGGAGGAGAEYAARRVSRG
jgi:hypothetical protein